MKAVNDLDKTTAKVRLVSKLTPRTNNHNLANAKYIRVVARETTPTAALSYVCDGCGKASRTGHPVGTLCKSCSKKQARND